MVDFKFFINKFDGVWTASTDGRLIVPGWGLFNNVFRYNWWYLQGSTAFRWVTFCNWNERNWFLNPTNRQSKKLWIISFLYKFVYNLNFEWKLYSIRLKTFGGFSADCDLDMKSFLVSGAKMSLGVGSTLLFVLRFRNIDNLCASLGMLLVCESDVIGTGILTVREVV